VTDACVRVRRAGINGSEVLHGPYVPIVRPVMPDTDMTMWFQATWELLTDEAAKPAPHQSTPFERASSAVL
jgi:hypothetical protein